MASLPWNVAPPRSETEGWVYQRRANAASNATQILGALLMARAKAFDGEFSEPDPADYRKLADEAALLAIRLNDKLDAAFPRPEATHFVAP